MVVAYNVETANPTSYKQQKTEYLDDMSCAKCAD